MKVLLNEKGFIQSYALIGDLVDGIDVPDPEDIDHFTEHYAAYKITDGKALLDETHQKALQTEAKDIYASINEYGDEEKYKRPRDNFKCTHKCIITYVIYPLPLYESNLV